MRIGWPSTRIDSDVTALPNADNEISGSTDHFSRQMRRSRSSDSFNRTSRRAFFLSPDMSILMRSSAVSRNTRTALSLPNGMCADGFVGRASVSRLNNASCSSVSRYKWSFLTM